MQYVDLSLMSPIRSVEDGLVLPAQFAFTINRSLERSGAQYSSTASSIWSIQGAPSLVHISTGSFRETDVIWRRLIAY